MTKPLQSAAVSTNNLLLKITVPKRVRVKRRRKSRESVHENKDAGGDLNRPGQRSMTRATQNLIESLRDNPTDYQLQAIGSIERTHRFRGNPSFGKPLPISGLTYERDAGLCYVNRKHAVHEKDARAHLTF